MSDFSPEQRRLLNNLLGYGNDRTVKELKEERRKLRFGYPGNKGDQLDKIIPKLPTAGVEVFVDVFGGGGNISLNVDYPLMVYNDICSGVTSFFRCLQKHETTAALTERIEMMIYSKEEWTFCKDSWADLTDDIVERSARWFYTIHCSFSNKMKEWARVRTPVGMRQGTFGKIADNVRQLHSSVSRWQIENDDWRLILKRYDSPRTLFYIDPTYLDATPGMYENELTRQDHVDLLHAIDELQGYVALSGYPNKLYDSHRDWDDRIEWKHTKTTRAGVACEENAFQGHVAGDTKQQSTEVLWIKEFA